MASRENFEIQVLRGERWSTETVRNSEDAAREAAKKFLADKKCEGARIVRNWTRSDGTMTESEIFKETRTVKDDGSDVRIVLVDQAPPRCEKPADYYGPDSRATMNRIFRPYLEKQFLTPTELIHNFKELKRIQDRDNLVTSAVDRIAGLQTKETEQDSKDRRDEIFKSVDGMSSRARKADALHLPKLTGRLSAVMPLTRELGGPEDADYLTLVVLSRELVTLKDWVAKLDKLCRLAAEETDAHAVELLDGVIADVLGANVVQEVLGYQPNLCSAIISMLDLSDGCMAWESSEARETVEILNKLFAEGKLPLSKATLIDRAHRQIKSPNPLNRADPNKELEEFRRLLSRVLTPTGLLAGPETAEAVTLRYMRMGEKGGAAGRRDAILACFRLMPDRAFGLLYICDLARTELAAEHSKDMAEQLELILACRRIGDLCLAKLSAKDRMLRATFVHGYALASALPEPVKKRLAEHIDEVLDRYLVEEQVIEKLDHQDSSLRDRAVRLVQFCAAGVLPEGRAMTRARTRILALLRQPNFDARFVDGIADPERAQKTLRDFHQLLVKAGFGG